MRFSLSLSVISAFAMLVGGTRPGEGQQSSAHPVRWSAHAPRLQLRDGDTVRVSLHATIDEFFHLYSTTQPPGGPVRTTVERLARSSWTLVGSVRAPAPDTIPDGNFGIMTEVYDDSVTLGVTLRAAANAPGSARLGVRYQACTARYCLPARTDTLTIALGGVAGIATPPVVSEAIVAPARLDVTERLPAPAEIASFGGAGGAGAFLLLAASMGVLALLTPCVFPMIPMTVTSFLAVGGEGDGRRGAWRAGAYAAGIVSSFTVLGVVTAALFGASGLARFSASPAVNLAIAALFTVFALSLLGVVRLSLPSALVARASRLPARGVLGPFAMGAVFTVTAFTCTAPFIGTLLVMSAQGDWRWPLAGMMIFSTTFAAPFVLLALVPELLRRRPRAGDWMPALELTVGAIELAAAVKFASNADLVLGSGVLTRQVVIALWIGILAALATALAWNAWTSSASPGRVRLAVIGVVIALTGTLIPGLFGRRLGELDAFLPSLSSSFPARTVATAELPWMLNDYRAALATAARDGRPILVDFTGYTCTNCRWMEANMFPRDDVKRALERFVRVRLYTDGLGEPFLAQQRLEQRVFGTVALPLYAALDSSGRPRATFLGMTRDAREFTAFLERGISER